MHFSPGHTMGKMHLHVYFQSTGEQAQMFHETYHALPPLSLPGVLNIMEEAVIRIYPLEPFLTHGQTRLFHHILGGDTR